MKDQSRNPISIIFDGTSRVGKILAIIVRYVDNWDIKQRLIHLDFLTKSLTGEETAHELNTLSENFSIKPNLIAVSMRDGASLNNVAMGVVKVVYPNIFDVRCFSHTLDLIGEKFSLPVLTSFSTAWISL